MYGDQVCYYKSRTKGIDIDFYLPEENLAVQVTYSLDADSYDREIGSLVKLSRSSEGNSRTRYLIVTHEDEKKIETDEITIEVVPLYRFLLLQDL